MTNAPVKTLIAVDDGVDPVGLEATVASSRDLQLVGLGEGIEQSWRLLENSSADLLVVATHGSSDRALRLIEGAARQRPERPVVVLYHGTPDGFLQRAFAAGADDLVCLPQPDAEVRFALEKVLARRRGVAATPAVQGPMVVVLGPKGGTGKTLTACNLAVAFATKGKRTALVDLDLQFGDVGIALGLSPEKTIYDLVRMGGTLDPGKVENYMTVHSPSGLRVLLAPTRPEQAGQISVEFLAEVYAALRTGSDVVVVDTPPAFSPEVIASIDAASHLCVVGMLDALSLKDSKLGLETLELMGHDPGKVSFVLNRSSAKAGISRDDAQAILGRAPDVLVPEEGELARLLTAGKPIVLASERSAVARAFNRFAEEYLRAFETGGQAPAPRKGRPGLLRLFLGRKRG
jgi:pilus assembly protein CpaE